MAENRKHIEFNITHYVCRSYLARQRLWLRNSNDFKRDFTGTYIGNIINEFQTSADTGSTKWRSPNRKQLYITLYNRYTRGSNGYTQVFGVARHDDIIADTRCRRPTPKTQDGDCQTGSSNISRSTTDRHAVPTAIPRFSGLPDTMISLPTPSDVDRHPKCKMAVAKPEVVICHVLQQIYTRFQRL